jgi:hypothetical protein
MLDLKSLIFLRMVAGLYNILVSIKFKLPIIVSSRLLIMQQGADIGTANEG